MSRLSQTLVFIGLAFIGLGASVALSGCAVSRMHATDDFGAALSQDLAAQIADPDARYSGDPAPASNGARAALAQYRYERNAVIRPAATSTSTAVANTGGSGGGATPGP